MVLEGRLASLEATLTRAIVLDAEDVAPGVAVIGSSVLIEDLASGALGQYRLASAHHSLGPDTISAASPIGQALIGTVPGTTVTVELPNGRSRSVRLVEVESEGPASPRRADARPPRSVGAASGRAGGPARLVRSVGGRRSPTAPGADVYGVHRQLRPRLPALLIGPVRRCVEPGRDRGGRNGRAGRRRAGLARGAAADRPALRATRRGGPARRLRRQGRHLRHGRAVAEAEGLASGGEVRHVGRRRRARRDRRARPAVRARSGQPSTRSAARPGGRATSCTRLTA
jgi:hypothetical protein